MSNAQLINQELRCLQDILPVRIRKDIDQKVVQVSEEDTMNHVHVRCAHKDTQNDVGKGQVDGLEGDTPDVDIGRRVVLGPYVENVKDHVAAKDGTGADTNERKDGFEDDTGGGTEKPHKGIVGRATAGTSVEGTACFVLFAKADHEVEVDQRGELERTDVAEASEEAPQFKPFRDVFPFKDKVEGRDNAEIAG